MFISYWVVERVIRIDEVVAAFEAFVFSWAADWEALVLFFFATAFSKQFPLPGFRPLLFLIFYL